MRFLDHQTKVKQTKSNTKLARRSSSNKLLERSMTQMIAEHIESVVYEFLNSQRSEKWKSVSRVIHQNFCQAIGENFILEKPKNLQQGLRAIIVDFIAGWLVGAVADTDQTIKKLEEENNEVE
ncbi:Hypothetical protein NTJ_06920 [Nesidiocoris tenuis]|uniref:Uncharacterized protein n=1 Tax=Nesidiocoris tenuis TaxID=355587 RepID=A0ABN7ATA1_9HEMI|nr:Hypothetical protein NTJ_06920 [Nesidiocoris tenuis]